MGCRGRSTQVVGVTDRSTMRLGRRQREPSAQWAQIFEGDSRCPLRAHKSISVNPPKNLCRLTAERQELPQRLNVSLKGGTVNVCKDGLS
jgi:hypothetical protein